MAITADPPRDVPFTRLENACKIGNSRVITLDAARIHTSIAIPMKIANNKSDISGERGLFMEPIQLGLGKYVLGPRLVSRLSALASVLAAIHPTLRLSKVSIFFDPRKEVVVVERYKVHTGYLEGCVDINTDPVVAPHTLFSTQDPSNQLIKSEALNIHIFFDVSVLEVFINERVAITSRIYPESGRCFGVLPFVRYAQRPLGNERAAIMECTCWEVQPSVTWIK
uniref:Putative invertase n=1 Tax=Hypocrea virens TaxID=29875 RepID=B7UUQ1_HYPVI|nr:putative invertase [Trichoderma virens]